jgi:hypothetical protein
MDYLQILKDKLGVSQIIDNNEIYNIANTKEIAKILEVTTPQAYQIMSQLEKQGIAYKYGYKVKNGWEDPSASNMQPASLYWQLSVPVKPNLLTENKRLKILIKEELTDMVRETATQAPGATLVRDKRLKFASVVNAVFNNYEAFTTDFDTKVNPAGKITIYWGVGFVTNPEGIYKFDVEIERVEGAYILQMFDKHTDELMQETPKNIADTKWTFQVNEVALEQGGFLFVRELEFDFKNNICDVTF